MYTLTSAPQPGPLVMLLLLLGLIGNAGAVTLWATLRQRAPRLLQEEWVLKAPWWHRLEHRFGMAQGKIAHDEKGVYWECSRCLARQYAEWDEVQKATGMDWEERR